jgi:hypothetical protein
MPFTEIISKFADYGALGLICLLLIYNVYFLQKKVISIIENNTKALTELKSIIQEKRAYHKGEQNG